MSTFIFTAKRQAILSKAAEHNLGLVTNPFIFGFERSNWNKNAGHLVSRGLLRPYVHGGFEITDAGRAALAEQTSTEGR